MESVPTTPPSRPSRPSARSLQASEAAKPRLGIEKFADGELVCLRFSGMIDEGFEGQKLGRSVACATLVLDLGGVTKISSFGIREWVDFITTAGQRCKEIVLIECAPKVVDQLNMVANFAGGGRVYSLYAPFRCDYCDAEHRVLLELVRDFDAVKAGKLPDKPCPTCSEKMYFDEDAATYFSYAVGQGPFELTPEVARFLAEKLDHRVAGADAKLRVDKVIEGRLTYLRLTGDLDHTLPKGKLADGLEGVAIVDLGGVSRIDPAGAAGWRGFIAQATPAVERLLLVGATPAFLERLAGKDDLGAKAQIASCTLPYTCDACGTTSAQDVDVAEHHAVLKFATAPEVHCPSCRAAMQCTASERAMTALPGLASPEIAPELARAIVALRARKIEKKPSTAIAPVARPAEAARRGALVPVLGALAAVAVVAAGVLAYEKLKTPPPGPYGIGPVAETSAAARPAWLTGDPAPASAACTSDAHGITCTGTSLALPSQGEAEDEASDAAYEALAAELLARGHGEAWLAQVARSAGDARAAAAAAYAADPLSTQARRQLTDGRRAVARVLARTAPPVAGRFWEAFDTQDGRRFVAFARVTASAADVARLVAPLHAGHAALGATFADLVPELGWTHGNLDHGAVIATLGAGRLQDMGLAERYVVLAVDGHDVPDAATCAKLLADEAQRLAEQGGELRLLVQPETGDPREFATQIAGPRSAADHTHTAARAGGAPAALPTGNVNVWDRYGGGR